MARTEKSIVVNAPAHTVYERLTRFDEYPSFVQGVHQVRRIDALRLEWQTGHGDQARIWEAEITQQVPARRIAWRTLHGARYEASVTLEAVAAAQTRLTLAIDWEPHDQILAEHGDAQAALEERADQDLARFKKHLEQHEQVSLHASPQTNRQTSAQMSGQMSTQTNIGVAASIGAGIGARAEPGQADASTLSDAERIGKTVGQTAAEREESARGPVHDFAHRRASGTVPPERSQANRWMRLAPTLPDLWNLWKQPLRVMRSVSRQVSHGMERVMDTVAAPSPPRDGQGHEHGNGRSAWIPAVETAQHEQKFIVCAELPGVKGDDVQVEIKYDRVTIKGDRRPEPRHDPQEQRRSERSYGHFYRVIALPLGAQPDGASAALHDGVLEITVPLAEHANQARRLDVRQA